MFLGIFTLEDEGTTAFFLKRREPIHSTQSVQYQKTGIPVKYAARKISNRAGFCRTSDARGLCHDIVRREQTSVRVSCAAFIVDVSNTDESWRRSRECWGKGSCRFSGFFVRDV